MSKGSEVLLQDILEAIDRIESYLSGLDQAAFERNTLVQDAVARNLEIIGEATKRLPFELRAQQSHIDWRKVAGLRDILIHQYSAVDLDLVWDVATEKLPGLRQAVALLRTSAL